MCTTCLVFAQPKTSERALWKSAKKFAKELTSDGWKINSSKGLREAVYEHYLALEDDKNKEIIAIYHHLGFQFPILVLYCGIRMFEDQLVRRSGPVAA